MIIFDTETTGLLNNRSVPLIQQPEIIEFGAYKVDDETLEVVDQLSFLIKPKMLPLPKKIIEITGITDDMLANEIGFARRVPELEAFFLGETTCVAHNCAFDMGMMTVEFQRLDRLNKFPWPSKQICTVEQNMDITGARMRLGQLYSHAYGVAPQEAHRAIEDVATLWNVVRWMRDQGKL